MEDEKDWTMGMPSDNAACFRWFDQDGKVRKVFYSSLQYTAYFDAEYRWHREDGPARQRTNDMEGFAEWWLHGLYLPCKSQEEFERYMKLKAFW